MLLEDIDAQLDNSADSEDLRNHILKIRRTFDLDDAPTKPVEDFEALRDVLDALAYRKVNDVQDR